MNEPQNRSSWEWWEIILAVGIVSFVAWIAFPPFITNGRNSPGLVCVNNLRLLDSGIYEWEAETGKTNGIVTWNDIQPYVARMRTRGPTNEMPKCPSGGTYRFGKLEVIPRVTCSVGTNAAPPHVLP